MPRFTAVVRKASGGRQPTVAIASLLLLALCCWPMSSAQAQMVDAKQKTPYKLSIVLDFAQHRMLTPLFQQQVESQLAALLRLNFGALAEVEVVRSHPLLTEIRDKGLQQALDGWEVVSEHKTHFVLIDFAEGAYHIQARQHDGATGLATPQVRRLATADRQQVARLAAQSVDRDFGLTGTVIEAGADTVQVAIQGSELGVPLQRWLKPGDVFAVCRMLPKGPKRLRSERLEWAILQVKELPQKGICPCRFFHRYQEDDLTPAPGTLGYRCLKLSTVHAPLALQLVPDSKDRPLSLLQVHVGHRNFEDRVQEVAVDAEGTVQTRDIFADVAFVRVVSGGAVLAQFPVPIVDRKPVTCRITVDPAAIAQGQIQQRYNRWLGRIYEVLAITADRVGFLNARLEQSPEEALHMAQRGKLAMTAEILRLQQEEQAVRDLAQKGSVALDFQIAHQRLQELQDRQAELGKFIDRLQNVIKESQTERRLQTLLEQASLLEEQSRYDEAMALYEQVLQESPKQTKVKNHLDKLRAAWTIRTPAQRQAREFIFLTWPEKMDAKTLKTNLEQARQALAVCRQAGDRLAPRRLLPATLAHAANLKKRLEVLCRSANTEDNRAEARLIGTLSEQLQTLYNDVRAWVKADDKVTR